MTDLSSLPPPPKGQTGVSLSSLAQLPAPPTGQTGMNLNQLPSSTFSQPQNLSQSLWSGIAGFGKAVASPVATIAARPFQAASDLGDYLGTQIEANKATTPGAKSAILAADQQRENQNQTESSLGGLVAPTPKNGADLEKDVGRAAETVALGLGPVAGGAAFGLGSSLEQGNDLLSPETAVQTIAGLAGGKILDLVGAPIFNAVGKVAGKITPQFLKDVVSKGASAISDFAASHNVLPGQVSHVINATANVADAVANKPFDATANVAKSGVDLAQRKIAVGDVPGMGQNVPDNVQTSASRLAKQAPLQGAGAARQATPLDMYNEAASAEEAAKADIKNPDAGSKLGTDYITPAFEKVIQLRRAAGTAMSDALKPIADKPTDIVKPIGDFAQHLEDDFNVKYNPTTKEVTTVAGDQTPLTSSDQKMIGYYMDELNKLGSNPSIGDLNSFMQRIPKELEVARPVANPTKVTPAEGIIKGNLSSLRNELDAKIDPKTGIAQKPYLKDYTLAKKTYARLSPIIDQGSGLFGKKDLEGNYVRDSSVAKRAIQSLSDGGSRALLLKIEQETGEPLLDRSLLTLQAMKDAGNPMGHSLLESVVNQGKDIPLESQGLNERIVRGLAGYAKGKVVGSPADQTRAFLKSLGKKK